LLLLLLLLLLLFLSVVVGCCRLLSVVVGCCRLLSVVVGGCCWRLLLAVVVGGCCWRLLLAVVVGGCCCYRWNLLLPTVDRFRGEPSKYNWSTLSKAIHTSNMRQVLANSINNVPSNKGWWFCMPKLNTSGTKSAIHPTDVCLPHVGVPFGISEDCMAAILTKMECLWINKKDGMTQFVQGGWELLRDEFKVAGTKLGVGKDKT
jgi:hypothetical protein